MPVIEDRLAKLPELRLDHGGHDSFEDGQAQREHLERLAGRAGIEVPAVAWSDEASEAITRLEHHLRQPALEVGV